MGLLTPHSTLNMLLLFFFHSLSPIFLFPNPHHPSFLLSNLVFLGLLPDHKDIINLFSLQVILILLTLLLFLQFLNPVLENLQLYFSLPLSPLRDEHFKAFWSHLHSVVSNYWIRPSWSQRIIKPYFMKLRTVIISWSIITHHSWVI